MHYIHFKLQIFLPNLCKKTYLTLSFPMMVLFHVYVQLYLSSDCSDDCVDEGLPSEY